ncbi:hypothetical protein CYLTODRAFT_401450 [Cylindrobasidium torrendii FP15055 ss-10]|uniref:Peptidase S1 domain-containing protein n=1 Tax=Cylindrobasidium torrendii FP15055 ss-10 TaxID=1314674 RepID=A0A0D7B3K8_9AGAR|nr:hypothetical protein CYLTODRAFT_401450 [Cylindrobasidium torrendii FP15055 ss-10]
MAGDDVVPKAGRLTDKYPFAFSDFGRGTPCVYKSGTRWATQSPTVLGKSLVREPRPVYGHAIRPTWVAIGTRICDQLESIGILWTCVNPFAYANAGESKPFCPLIICVGVNPDSLSYEDAVAGAVVVKDILASAGFPNIEVAFIESVMHRTVTSTTASPKLLSFNPLINKVPNLRKPFSPALGLAIASRAHPSYEGTAALYFCLPGGNSGRRVAVLTCAHVARPLPVHANTGKNSQCREEIVALGVQGYNKAIGAMMSTIGDHLLAIDAWNDSLRRLGEPAEGEDEDVAEKRAEYLDLVEKAKREINKVKAIHAEVTENFSTLDQRTLGFVLHSENIEVPVEPYKFTNDWALIELYNEKIDWTTFKGNKVWVADNLSTADYGRMMFPQPQDRKDYKYPPDGLLQAFGIVQDAEMRNPQHLDVHGEKCLLVVKNGLTTGTTIGRLNGLESFTHVYNKEYDISQKSLEIAVLPYDNAHGKFSEAGDSGSVVLDRDGRIVGILTGGSGAADETDTAYLTPYWWVEKQVKDKFPGAFLYDVVA